MFQVQTLTRTKTASLRRTAMAKARKMKDIPQEVKSLPFFYPEIKDSRQASDYIKQFDPMGGGCYLLRPSSKGDNFLTISVSISGHSVRHVNVVFEFYRGVYQYYIVPEIKFSAFSELCKFYKEHRIGNLEKIDNVRLLYPINRPSYPGHEYERLGNVNPMSSGTLGGGASHNGWNVPQMVSPTLTGNGVHHGFPVSPGIRDSQGSDRRLSETSSNKQVESPKQTVTTNHLPRNPDVKPPATGQSKAKKLNVNGKGDRPPLPIPNCSFKSDVYYSSPKENVNKIDHLRKMLKASEFCECGIRLLDSELPHGYTIHRSHEESSKNRLFYQNANGETTWTFPPHLLLELTEAQRQAIIRLSLEKDKDPPKILFNPEYNRIITQLLAERKKSESSSQCENSDMSESSGQVFADDAVLNSPNSQPQLDLAKQVLLPSQPQQSSPGVVGLQESSSPRFESDPSVHNPQTTVSDGQEQYLSGTPRMYVPTSPNILYISKTEKKPGFQHELHSPPGRVQDGSGDETHPKFV